MQFRLEDLFDIMLLAAGIYGLLKVIRGTRAARMVIGLGLLLGIYAISDFFHLDALGFVLNNLFGSVVVILVVLFQADIRNALTRVGILTSIFREGGLVQRKDVGERIIQACGKIAAQGLGATIVLERDTGLRNIIETGESIDGKVSVSLLESLFQRRSQLHDGAVVIDAQGRLAAAGCLLPLTGVAIELAEEVRLGTRHRSALSLSQQTDALVFIVSEESGKVSLAEGGQLRLDASLVLLRERIGHAGARG